MRVAIRADSGTAIGFGHLSRCLTLGEELRRRGANTEFICRPHPGHGANLVAQRGFTLRMLARGETPTHDTATWLGTSIEQDAQETAELLGTEGTVDWLLVDHYAANESWRQRSRHSSKQILAFDDLDRSHHDCDIVVRPGVPADRHANRGTADATSRVLAGAEHTLVSRAFAQTRITRSRRLEPRTVRHVLVFFGSTAPLHAHAVLSSALARWPHEHETTVITAATGASHDQIVGTYAHRPDVKTLSYVDDMPRLMEFADLFIGAGGSTTWERCFVGLPSIVLSIAENQVAGSLFAASTGSQTYLGRSSSVTADVLLRALEATTQERRQAQAETGRAMVDGQGANRIVDAMERT